MYTIYHIPGVKIGCDQNYPNRPISQGFTDYEILEEYEDIYEASKRERELQKEYGYRIDSIPYFKSIERGKKSFQKFNTTGITKEQRSNAGRTRSSYNTRENLSKAGKVSSKSEKHISKQEMTCPHCGKTSRGVGYSRWHGDNCKNRP